MGTGCSNLPYGFLDDRLHVHISLAYAAFTDGKQSGLGFVEKVEYIG